MAKNIGDLEQSFREAVAKLPDYKRAAVWEYVNELTTTIKRHERESNDLAQQIVDLTAVVKTPFGR